MRHLAAFIFALLLTSPALADIELGKPAPDFNGMTSNNKIVKLSDYKGHPVVLEWNNNECPFVKKHYDAGNMQQLQKLATDEEVTWLTIISSAPGKQGHVDGEGANKIAIERKANPSAIILDESGAIGRLYNATTTPHMFVIDKNGLLVYAGAIDNRPSPAPASLTGAHNYVTAALDDLEAGKPVGMPQTKPYGCGIKYAN